MFSFKRSTSTPPTVSQEEDYLQLAHSMSFQRNIIIFFSILALIAAFISLIRLFYISSNKTLSPFVIETEQRSGITKAVTPAPKDKYTTDIEVRDFHLRRYVTARESYSLASYRYYYNVVVQEFSTEGVFSVFKRFLFDTHRDNKTPSLEAQASLIRLDSSEEVRVTIKVIKELDQTGHNIPGKVVQVYFTQNPISNSYLVPRERIATIGYDFNKPGLTEEALEVNPLRFQVLYYSLTDVVAEKL